jgi:hypothetical protein
MVKLYFVYKVKRSLTKNVQKETEKTEGSKAPLYSCSILQAERGLGEIKKDICVFARQATGH